MQSAITENSKFYSFKVFVDISPPTDLLLLRSSIPCLTSFTKTGWNESLLVMLKFCLIVLILGWLTNLIKMLSVPSSLVYDGGTLEELSVHIYRSTDSTMDPKYSWNVLAISLSLKIISSFLFTIMSVSALLCLFEKLRHVFYPKRYTSLAWIKIMEVF